MRDILMLTIRPEGETEDWEFSSGSYCGKAKDSVGISFRRMGCVLTRTDVRKLIDWLQEVEATWSEPL